MISFFLKMPVSCVAILDYYRALLFFNAVRFASNGIVLRRVEQFTNIEDHPFFYYLNLSNQSFCKRPPVILQGLVALELCSVTYIMLCFPCSPEKRPPPHPDVTVGGEMLRWPLGGGTPACEARRMDSSL